jgi:hypothetical protein
MESGKRGTSAMGFKDMSHSTMIALMSLSVGGGLIGGYLHSALVQTVAAQTDGPRVIRATSVELVDEAGKRIGILGTDASRNVGLAFFDARGKKRAEFGLGRGENPRFDINGPEGHSRLSLDLGESSKPRLMMSDSDFTGRVYLGVNEPDAPDPEWKYNNWILRFTGDHTKPLAIVGMTTDASGGLAVFDLSGHRWQTPLK